MKPKRYFKHAYTYGNDNYCGIYFLLNKKKIVYIGRSVHFIYRIYSHSINKDFDRFRLIYCDLELQAKYELRWIRKFQPKYNIKGSGKLKIIKEGKTFFAERIS